MAQLDLLQKWDFERNHQPLEEVLPRHMDTHMQISAVCHVLFRDWTQRVSDT